MFENLLIFQNQIFFFLVAEPHAGGQKTRVSACKQKTRAMGAACQGALQGLLMRWVRSAYGLLRAGCNASARLPAGNIILRGLLLGFRLAIKATSSHQFVYSSDFMSCALCFQAWTTTMWHDIKSVCARLRNFNLMYACIICTSCTIQHA